LIIQEDVFLGFLRKGILLKGNDFLVLISINVWGSFGKTVGVFVYFFGNIGGGFVGSLYFL